MAQERFADVVERFTTGFAADAPAETIKQWQEELERGVRRLRNLHDLVTNPIEPKTGQTPRVEIYKRNKSRLYRYESARTHRTPVLFVPNLGISRPYIFDLLPGGSFIEHMTQQGFDFYLLDWGVFGPEDNDLSVEDCVTKILPRMARQGARDVGDRRALGARLLHGGAPLGVVHRLAPGDAGQELRQHGRARSTSRRSGSSASGSARSTSTSTASSTRSARCPPTWSRRASSCSSRRWISRPT